MTRSGRITVRVTEQVGEVELLRRKQFADAGHELERLEIAGQVITQLTADDEPAGEPHGKLVRAMGKELGVSVATARDWDY